jgi:DNA-binding winged helix-turn-helix (wHTH) protein
MARREGKTFWEALQWSAPITMLIVVMPASLAILHVALNQLSLTSNTLILLLVTVIYSLGSNIWISVILTLESSLYLNYFLTPPFHSFRVANSDDLIALAIFLLSSTSVSALVKVLTTKQNEIQGLLTKIESMTNKGNRRVHLTYRLGDWLIDFEMKTLTAATQSGGAVHLTPIEWKLLEVLVRAEGGLVKQKDVLAQVWGEKYVKETNYLRLYLSQLRKKLEESPKRPTLLITEPGSGYRAMAQREIVK